MAIAVFGDLHGRLRLMLQLARLWQREHALKLDGILICGDLGFFPRLDRLDSATRRHAQRDPEELGFGRFFALPSPTETDEFITPWLAEVNCPIHWCNGNHEDFDELDRLVGELVAADCFGRFLYQRNGSVRALGKFQVAALGGAPEHERPKEPRAYVDPKAVRKLHKERFDVLLAHGSPKGIGGESEDWGSTLLRNLILDVKPRYCFYGHHRTPNPPVMLGDCQCCWLNDVAFESPYGPLEHGCMGILHEGEFEILDEPWMKQVTGGTWRDF